MRKLLILLFLLGIFAVCLLYNDEIVYFLVEHCINYKKENSTLSNNSYASNRSYEYIQLTNNFTPYNEKDILNIYYTVLNSGMKEFTFYCPKEYKNCINDIKYISNNQSLLSNINNFVPVYNTFKDMDTDYNPFLGKVSISIEPTYNTNEINTINKEIDRILKEIVTDDMNDSIKIKNIHDYIINNTKYDIERSDNKITTYQSDTAYGALIEHYAICGGYADSTKLFLDRLGLPNYKISSENHVWNLVYLDNEWYHLDLTWDDPVTSTNEDVLLYDYFLISTEELNEIETDQHIFDKTIYQEAIKKNS